MVYHPDTNIPRAYDSYHLKNIICLKIGIPTIKDPCQFSYQAIYIVFSAYIIVGCSTIHVIYTNPISIEAAFKYIQNWIDHKRDKILTLIQ